MNSVDSIPCSLLQHNWVWEEAEEAGLNKVHKCRSNRKNIYVCSDTLSLIRSSCHGASATTRPQISTTWSPSPTWGMTPSRLSMDPCRHKVLTYIEYRAVSGVFRTIGPPPPLYPESVSSPRPKGGGYTLTGRWGGGGSIFRKTPDIGLTSYSMISTVCRTFSSIAYYPDWRVLISPCLQYEPTKKIKFFLHSYDTMF